MSIIEKYSAGGIVLHGDRVLTLYVPGYDEIVFPKGTIEHDEVPEETAQREVEEETGYRVKVEAPLGTTAYEFTEDGTRYKKIVSYFLMSLIDEDEAPQPRRQEGEEFENLWLPVPEALERLTHDVNCAMLKKAMGLRRH